MGAGTDPAQSWSNCMWLLNPRMHSTFKVRNKLHGAPLNALELEAGVDQGLYFFFREDETIFSRLPNSMVLQFACTNKGYNLGPRNK